MAPLAPMVGTRDPGLTTIWARRGRDPGNQVEQKEREVPEAVFNAAPEHKEKEHVSQQVQPPAVQKHGNKNGTHGESCRKGEEGRRRIAGGDQSIQEDKAVQVRAQGEFNEKGPKVHDDQEQSKCPEGAPANVVG